MHAGTAPRQEFFGLPRHTPHAVRSALAEVGFVALRSFFWYEQNGYWGSANAGPPCCVALACPYTGASVPVQIIQQSTDLATKLRTM